MKRLAPLALLLIASWTQALPSGHKWFPARIPVHYTVFAHSTINGMPPNSYNSAVLPRVQEAFLSWTSTRVACTGWRTQYDGTFTSPSNGTARNGNDSINRVIWLGGGDWRYNNSTLGLTTTFYFPDTGEIFDADMEMNNNVAWANDGNFNRFDYESVVLHEAGHFLGLDHTPAVGAAVMFPSISNGQVKRTLVTADVNDVCGLYPGSGSGSQGNPCTMQSQCTGGLVCRNLQGSAGGKICTVDCTSNANACSTVAPFTCQNADVGRACLPPAAPADYCKFCLDGTGCSSGNCLRDGLGHHWCTTSCGLASPCPSGSVCLDVNSAASCTGSSASCVCAPAPTAQGILCPGQCTGSTCGTTAGFSCSNGTCQATGNENDRCELSGFCKDCLICIGNVMAANCRKCCGGNGQGGECNQCPNATCTGMDACVGLQGSNDRICYPQNGADLCMPCGGTTACLNGNTCIGGKCHTSCNPQATSGACQACQPTSATTGLCACPGEERNEGESCGGSGVSACRTGLACANGTCRRTCVVGTPSTCAAGQVCQNVGGTAVCVGDIPGTRCAMCNGTSCSPGSTCYQGRCYTTCNATVKGGPCDYSCVDVGGGVNVCACDDQIHGSGSACGANPIAACADRLICVSGTCQGECNPNFPSCPILTECKALPGSQFTFVCQPISSGTGGGGGNTNPLDCTNSGSMCPGGSTCVPNGDGTATCRSQGSVCDPTAMPSTCPADTVCRSIEGQPSTFRCQLPITGNGGGCGCHGAGGLAGALALAWCLRRRRQ